jgi:hypothetical protein
MRWAENVAQIKRKGKEENESKILVGKPERKRPLGRPSHKNV